MVWRWWRKDTQTVDCGVDAVSANEHELRTRNTYESFVLVWLATLWLRYPSKFIDIEI